MPASIGRYVVTGELGRGGMGIVFAANDPVIDRTLAVKVILLAPGTDAEEAEQLRKRLFSEARSAGRLSHRGIVTVYDVGEEGGRPFIVMEMVEGPSLLKMMQSDRKLPVAEALDILGQTADALDCAHQNGVLHRDIKPANIMLHKGATVKIADFGIAKIVSTPQQTRTNVVMGTPSYMSPEQVEALPLDGRSDQFSLAVIAFEMLTGSRPFQADSVPSLLHNIAYGKRPSPREVNPALPSAVDAVFARALARASKDRYATCTDFVAALRTAVGARKPRANWWIAAVAVILSFAAVAATWRFAPKREPLAVARFTAEPGAISTGGSATLAWNVPGATEVSIEPGVGKVAATGSVTVKPSASTSYALIANGSGGSASASAFVEVKPPAVVSEPVLKPVPVKPPEVQRREPKPVSSIDRLRESANAGDSKAMIDLGRMYATGDGVTKDHVEAAAWFRKAADAGDAAGMYLSATMYELGLGVKKDFDEAARLYQKAANNGNADARKRIASAAPAVHSISVAANRAWTDTGLSVQLGDTISVSALGQIKVSAHTATVPLMTPAGYPPDCQAASAAFGWSIGRFPAPRLPCWSLTGKIGESGKIFPVGMKKMFPAPAAGELFFGINDNNVSDNSGSWTTAVTVQRGWVFPVQ